METKKGRTRWSDEKLLSRALSAKTSKAYWDTISELRRRASASLYGRCVELARSELPAERTAGVDILAQLYRRDDKKRYASFPYRKKVLALCLEMLAIEKDATVLESVLCGIACNNHYQYREGEKTGTTAFYRKNAIIDAVLPFIDSEDNTIRRATLGALTGIESMKAIRGLIALSQDKCSHIRDWATFAIGTQSDLDNDEIRKALHARCTDRHHDTRMEAIYGLAKRKDDGVKPYLEKKSADCTVYVLQSIQALDAKEYLPWLEGLLKETENDPDTYQYWLGHLKECVETLRGNGQNT